jgi:hypothetical protein
MWRIAEPITASHLQCVNSPLKPWSQDTECGNTLTYDYTGSTTTSPVSEPVKDFELVVEEKDFKMDVNALAKQFSDFYYATFDSDRSQLGNVYVCPPSKVLTCSALRVSLHSKVPRLLDHPLSQRN